VKTKKFKRLGKNETEPIENWLELNSVISDAVSFVRFIADDGKIDGKSMTLAEIREDAQSVIAEFDECLRAMPRKQTK
jgi:hypothetical protein